MYTVKSSVYFRKGGYRMKKALSILLVLLLAVSFAFAGGSSETAAATTANADDPYADLGNYVMMVGHSQPQGNPRYTSMEKFAADVAERTNGHVTVQVFGNGQLGTEKEMLEQVVIGTIQGMRGGQFDFTPRLLMFTLPFLAQTREEVTALLHSDLAAKVCAEAEAETGTVIINLCDAGGFRQFSNNRHQITKPEDFQGLKMRTAGMTTIDKTLTALGATITPVPYSDLYMALRTGVADGQENPWVNITYNVTFASERYTLAQNLPSYRIEPYSDHSLSAYRIFSWKKHKFKIQLDALNLSGKNYEVIRFYPMPGRNYKVSLSYIL